ncbi:vgrS protein [Salmonella bongori]|nr:vgrS protein [Salmonella bongori]
MEYGTTIFVNFSSKSSPSLDISQKNGCQKESIPFHTVIMLIILSGIVSLGLFYPPPQCRFPQDTFSSALVEVFVSSKGLRFTLEVDGLMQTATAVTAFSLLPVTFHAFCP